MDDCMGNFGFYSNKAGILIDVGSNINHINSLQLSWNLPDSPGFLAIVPGTGGPFYYCYSIVGPGWRPDETAGL